MSPRHRGSIAQDCDQIAAAGVFEGVVRILLDFQTRLGHARGVRQAKIALRTAGLGLVVARRTLNSNRQHRT
jgi:hypothetical protein